MRLIDADELDRAFSKARWYPDGGMHHWGDRPNWCLWGEEVEQLIAEVPTIDAEPVRRGRWVIEPGIGCKCSACGFDIGNDLDFMEYVKYCPSCGAKMEV